MTRRQSLTKFDNSWKVYLFVVLCVLVFCSTSHGALCTTCCPINCCTPLSSPYYYGAQGITYPINSPELQSQLQENIKSYPYLPWNDCSKRFANSLFPSWSEAVNAYRHYYSIYDDPRKVLSTKGNRQKVNLGSKSRLKLSKADNEKPHTVLIPIPTITALILRPVRTRNKTAIATASTSTSTATTTSTTTTTSAALINPTSILGSSPSTPVAIPMDQPLLQQNIEFTTQTSTSVHPDTPAAVVMAPPQPVESRATEAPVRNTSMPEFSSAEIGMLMAQSPQAMFHYSPVNEEDKLEHGEELESAVNATYTTESESEISATVPATTTEKIILEEEMSIQTEMLKAKNVLHNHTFDPLVDLSATSEEQVHQNELALEKVSEISQNEDNNIENEAALTSIKPMEIDFSTQAHHFEPEKMNSTTQMSTSTTTASVPMSSSTEKITEATTVYEIINTSSSIKDVDTSTILILEPEKSTTKWSKPSILEENTTLSMLLITTTEGWPVAGEKANISDRMSKIFTRHATPSNTQNNTDDTPFILKRPDEEEDDRNCAFRNPAAVPWWITLATVLLFHLFRLW